MRPTTKLLMLLLLVVGVLVVATTLQAPDVEQPVPVHPGLGADSSLAAGEREHEATLERVPANTRLDGQLDGGEHDALPTLLVCRQRANGSALPGVRLFRGNDPIAGPSDSRGVIEVRDSGTGELTLWVEGWLPVTVRGEELPGMVAFETSSASFEVRFLNGSADHRLLRSVLQRRGPGYSSGAPWAPQLAQRGLDVYVADKIPAGSYDVHFWVTFPDGEPRPFSRMAVEIEERKTTRVSIDLGVARDAGELESDS